MEVLINRISRFIGDVGQLDSSKQEVISFGLYYLIMFLFSVIGIICISSLLHTVSLAIAAVATAAVFRNFSGGAHFSRPEICMAVSSLVYPFAGLLAKNVPEFIWWPIVVVSGMFALLVSFRLAPVEVPEKPIPLDQRRTLRLYSILFSLLWIGTVLFINPTK